MNKKRTGIILGCIIAVAIACFAAYNYWWAPTRILIINPLPAQAADIALNNDCSHIRVKCIKMEEVKDLSGYDAIMMYGRGTGTGSCQRYSSFYQCAKTLQLHRQPQYHS